jgi:guanine deaminase
MKGFRGSILHFLDDASPRYIEDGVLLVENGQIIRVEEASTLGADIALTDYSGKLILPGFVDTHTHYVQTDMIASHGEQLLAWLERYTFPTEKAFRDPELARQTADFFLQELLRNGTTTAGVFCTIHPQSVDALFSAAQSRKMRMIGGRVMMDRNAPDDLRDTAQTSYDESKALIERWHGRDRLSYAVTPRFAPTSSDQQMRLAGQLFQEHEGLFLQTHLAENRDELKWIAELYPDHRSYVDVYRDFGQLAPRAVFGHGIWIDDEDRAQLASSGSSIAFCPTSNLFLGSGLFDYDSAAKAGIRVGLGTDVGAGTSFSMLKTLSAAYQVLQMRGQSLSATQAFYLATLGGARSLWLDDKIGNFESGKEADFVVIDWQATPLLARRIARAETLEEKLFALMILGDDRAIAATHILGERAA